MRSLEFWRNEVIWYSEYWYLSKKTFVGINCQFQISLDMVELFYKHLHRVHCHKRFTELKESLTTIINQYLRLNKLLNLFQKCVMPFAYVFNLKRNQF